MLNSLKLSDKTYEELLAEAIAQIPLYSKEWTNFNPADPGITILQNLTAFQQLQQDEIDNVSEETKRKLLKLLGYVPRDNKAATVLVQAPADGGPILPPGHQLWSGSIPFETMETEMLQPWGLAAVYSVSEEGSRDLSKILMDTGKSCAYPFGRQPKEGNGFVCILTGTPEVGEPLRLWLQISEEQLRAPFDDVSSIPLFSSVRWQYYTQAGWRDARFEDETSGLLRSGSVTLWLEDDLPAELDELSVHGCALRCILDQEDYDRLPKLEYLAAHLFPMVQKETKVQMFVLPGQSRVELRGRLPLLGTFLVFCREEKNGPYYLYQRGCFRANQGRVYQVEETLWGAVLQFAPEHMPCDDPDAVRVVCYDHEMIHHRSLGSVYGYDDQIIQVDLMQDVLPEGFTVAVELPQRNGPSQYWFVSPEEIGPEGFAYHLRSHEAQICIDNPGGGGYKLLLAQCACTLGQRGNLRGGAVLEQRGGYDGSEVETNYICPSPGRGGESCENTEQLRVRFSSELRKTSVAVCAEDYEELVRRTPGLCIRKVKAVAKTENNLVKIAVMPYTEEAMPKLSQVYREKIAEHLEPYRLLSTRFELCSPQYVPIGVSATVCVRGMADQARGEIERFLNDALDHVNGFCGFGGEVRFNEIYRKLNALPFVESVEALNLFPENRSAALVGGDIHLSDDSLCYPGTIQLTIRKNRY